MPLLTTAICRCYYTASEHADYDYLYDPVVHSYVVKITDAHGLESRYSYDYRCGRLVTVVAPEEQGNGTEAYTWKAAFGRPAGAAAGVATDRHVAFTYHYDPQHPDNPIATATRCDGWGRILQVKQERDVEGAERAVTSALVAYDAFGRAVRHYDPWDEPLDSLRFFSHRSSSDYDLLDRVLTERVYNGSDTYTTTYQYSIPMEDGRRLICTKVTDANGRSSFSYSDAPGRTLRVTDALGGSTRFTYDDMGQLLRSTDPDGFSTVYEYDLQGRLVRRPHPDAGVTAMTYDPAGHVVRQVDANGDTVTTDYHYDRQMAVHYSRYPQNDVAYTYGTAGNGKGRVVGIPKSRKSNE